VNKSWFDINIKEQDETTKNHTDTQAILTRTLEEDYITILHRVESQIAKARNLGTHLKSIGVLTLKGKALLNEERRNAGTSLWRGEGSHLGEGF